MRGSAVGTPVLELAEHSTSRHPIGANGQRRVSFKAGASLKVTVMNLSRFLGFRYLMLLTEHIGFSSARLHLVFPSLLPDYVRVLTYLHLHPFEGYSVSLAEPSSHHYPVDSPRAHVGPLSATALMLSERRAAQDGLSSLTTTFPLGDLRVEQGRMV